jgi:hypothetical protein
MVIPRTCNTRHFAGFLLLFNRFCLVVLVTDLHYLTDSPAATKLQDGNDKFESTTE